MKPFRASGSPMRSAMMPTTISSETSAPDSMTAFALSPIGVSACHRRAQHVPGRKLGNAILLHQSRRLCALPRAWRPEQYQPHRLPPPEPRPADQPFVLMRLQVSMDLRHRVHRDVHDDQQRRAAEIERQRGIGNQPFRQQADQRQITRAKHRDAREDIVDELRRPLARTHARNEAAVLLQIVGGVGRIEDRRRVEEREEHDQHDVKDEIERRCRARAASRPC